MAVRKEQLSGIELRQINSIRLAMPTPNPPQALSGVEGQPATLLPPLIRVVLFSTPLRALFSTPKRALPRSSPPPPSRLAKYHHVGNHRCHTDHECSQKSRDE